MIRRLLFVAIIVLLIIAAFRCLAASNEKSKVTMVLNEDMFSIPGKEVAIQRAEYPAGWVGERHYHTGDIFVYVLEGQFVVDVEGGKRVTIDSGEVYHEAVNKVMQARNPSTTKPTKLILFQVGEKGKPRVMIAN